MKKKKLIIGLLVLALGIAGISSIYIMNHNKTAPTDTVKVEDQDTKPQVYANNSVKTTIYLPDGKGGFTKKEVDFKGSGVDVQKQVFNYVIDSLKASSDISVKEGAKVIDMKIWDETLQVNLSKEMNDTKVKQSVGEKYVIGSVVNSLLSSSKSFTDVQFLVEGERPNHLFGTISTRNPFMEIK